jgi:hypothetical protein
MEIYGWTVAQSDVADRRIVRLQWGSQIVYFKAE